MWRSTTRELPGAPDVFAEDSLYAIRVNDEFTIDVMMAGEVVDIRVLDLPGLLKTKHGVRPQDQMDTAVISAALAAMPTRD
jgi:hypothetical protein